MVPRFTKEAMPAAVVAALEACATNRVKLVVQSL